MSQVRRARWDVGFVVACIGLMLWASSSSRAADGFISQFGDPGSWGSIGTVEHLHRLEAILEDRKAYATSIVRTDVYVEQSESGDAAGGGGQGTMSDPFRCRTTDDLRAFLIANISANKCFRLRGVFRTSGPNGRGIRVYGTGVAMRPWPNDPDGWTITAFAAPYGPDGWEATDLGTSTLYARVDPEPVYWIKIGNTDEDVDTYPCRLVSGVVAVSEPIGTELAAWYYDAAHSMLYVNLPKSLEAAGRVSIGTVEPMKHAVHVNGHDLCGIRVLDSDGVLIEGGLVEGFGFDRQVNGNWPVQIDNRGTNLVHLKDVKARFGWYHTLGALTSSAGIRVYENVTIGYCRPAPAGTGGGGVFTSFVDYAASGGQEVYIDGMHFINGTLPDRDWSDSRRGIPLYGHTVSWSTAMALEIRRSVTVRDKPLSGFQTYQSMTGIEGMYTPHERRDAGRYRHFAIEDDVAMSGLTLPPLYLPSSFAIHYNCRWRFGFRAPASPRSVSMSTERFRGVFLNCLVEGVAEQGNWTNSSLNVVSYVPPDASDWRAHASDWVHSVWSLRAESGAVGVRLNVSPVLQTSAWTRNGCGWFNHVFSAEGGIAPPRVHLPQGDPFEWTGSSRSVYAGGGGAGSFPMSDVNGNVAPMVLGSLFVPSTPDDVPSALMRSAGEMPLPTGLSAEFDLDRRVRGGIVAPGPVAVSASIGACCVGTACVLESEDGCAQQSGSFLGAGVACSPVACEAAAPCPPDVNGDGRVDLLDLLVFQSDWSANLGQIVTPGTSGDFNQDGMADLLDLLAFNAAWSANLGQACP